MDKKNLIIAFAISVVLTLISLFFITPQSLVFSASVHSVVRGFPFHFIEQVDSSAGDKITFLFSWFFVNVILWFIGTALIFFFTKTLKNKQRYDLLVLALLLGGLLNYVSLSLYDSCVTGFPIRYDKVCSAAGVISPKALVFGPIIDIIFWLAISIIFISYVYGLRENRWTRKFYFVFVAIAITSLTFLDNQICDGFFCLFSGRGMPFPYYNHIVGGGFDLEAFGLDVIYWSVVCLIVSAVFYIIKLIMNKINSFLCKNT